MPFPSPALQVSQFANALLVTAEGKLEALCDYKEHAETGCIFKHRALISLVGAINQCARRMTNKAFIAEMQRRVADMFFGELKAKKQTEKAFLMTKAILANEKILQKIGDDTIPAMEKQADSLTVACLKMQLLKQEKETEVAKMEREEAKRETLEVQIELERKDRALANEKATSVALAKEVNEIERKYEELEGELEEVDERKFFLEDELRKMSLGGLESTPRISRAPRRKSLEMDEAGEVGASRSVSARPAENQPACSAVDQVASECDTPARMRGPAIDYSDSQRADFERYGAQAAAGEISTTKAIKNFLADNPALAEREAAVKSQIARARKNAMAAQEAKGKKE